MSSREVVYDASSINSLSDIQHIRHRPSAYIPDTGIAGIWKLTDEIIANSTDELEFIGGGQLDITMFISPDRKSFHLAVSDSGRGIPYQKLIESFSSARTSGKFSTASYQFSSGIFGIGSTVVLSLSNAFRAITLNEDVIGDAVMRYDNVPSEITTTKNNFRRTGTIVIFEPDVMIFPDISDFIDDYSTLVQHLHHLSLFGKYRIRLNVIENFIPDSLYNSPAVEVIEYLNNVSSDTTLVFDSRLLNREEYILNYFGLQKNWTGRYHIEGSNTGDTLRVTGDMLFLLSNSTSVNTKLTFVNNILFNDNASLHVKLLHLFIKTHVAKYIEDKAIRTFFVEQYKLPIWLVLDIKYSAAQFAGFAKSSFKDLSFVAPYNSILERIITKEMVADIYELISAHIVVNYNRVANGEFKNTSNRHISSLLARPSKFNNCSTNNRSEAELFLIEGDSAKSDQDRDSSFQASYTLSGKPINCLTEIDKLGESVNLVKKNLIFQDIIRILNIVPGSTDLSTMNFGKVLIMADADTHGYHISNILISNLYAICPALIEQGKIYLVKAPLYSLRIKDLPPIYVRDETELNATLAYQVYHQCIEIDLVTEHTSHTLSREELVVFSELISTIGDEIERMSKEYMIPAILLEQLSLMTHALHPAAIDVDYIRHQLGCDVKYVPASNLLVVSLGTDDVIVPLTQIADLIYQRLFPLYKKIYYGKSKILITTKNTELYNKAQVSIVMLNMIFKQMGSIFTIKRYKGLGSMNAVDRARTCINPKTRRVYQITSVGDIDQIFAMMGTDSTVRKELILRTY